MPKRAASHRSDKVAIVVGRLKLPRWRVFTTSTSVPDWDLAQHRSSVERAGGNWPFSPAISVCRARNPLLGAGGALGCNVSHCSVDVEQKAPG
jgi:hypothetical protein